MSPMQYAEGGPWRHWKGGRYMILGVAETHNHNGDLDVVYVSLTFGKLITRPLRRDSRDQDSWMDVVKWPDGIYRERFFQEGILGRDTTTFFDEMFKVLR